MKNKIGLVLVLVLAISFSREIEIINADDGSVTQVTENEITCYQSFVNSQDPSGKDLLNFISWNQDVEVRNDGGYKYGVPGIYNVTYGIKGTEVEKTFVITVVESKGTLLDIEVEGGNVILVEKTDGLEQLDNYVLNTVKARCLVKAENGELSIVESTLVNARSGGGGTTGYFESTYVPSVAMPYYSMPKEIANIQYYNPINTEWMAIETRISCLEKEYLKSMSITDSEKRVTVEGSIGKIEGQKISLQCKTSLDIPSTMFGTNEFVAYQMEIVDFSNIDGIPIPVPNGKFKVSMEVPSTLDAKKIVVYKKKLNHSMEKVSATLKGNGIEFVINDFPATIALVEEDVVRPPEKEPETSLEQKPIISSGTNSSWNQNNNIGITIKSSASFSSFVGVMVDGKEIDKKHYTVLEGSIIVQLNPEYLSTLTMGEHSITILSTQGNSSTNFYIVKENKKEMINRVDTSDNTMIGMELLLITCSAISLLFLKKKHTRRE